MRIVFVLNSLQGGGAERVACILANAWVEAGHHVIALLLEQEGIPAAYPLDAQVAVHRLGIVRHCSSRVQALARIVKGVFTLRAAIRKSCPDVVVSFIDEVNVRTSLACKGLGLPVIISERVHPGKYRISWFWNWLRPLSYGRASVLVVQTNEIAEWCRSKFGMDVAVIPNPVPEPSVRMGKAARERKTIVAAGRLMYQKGFDLLLKAFAGLVEEFPHWDLNIYGEGPALSDLQKMADELGVGERVHFQGWVSSLAEEMALADIFCLSSRFEGFPNVLCEAMSIGLPVVATDCSSGPADIITHGEDGLLVAQGNVAALQQGLRQLMDDSALRERLGARAMDITRRFSLERILGMWDDCIESQLNSVRGARHG